MAWYTDLGIDPDNLRLSSTPGEVVPLFQAHRRHRVPLRVRRGTWAELEGIANRTDFDLRTHSEKSGADLSYFDQATGERWIPYVIEPAAGLTRAVLAFLLDAYAVDEAPTPRVASTSARSCASIRGWLR